MGMYCCCNLNISGNEYEGKPQCTCSWEGWISTCDWPKERKNKHIPISLPSKDGKYLVRIQTESGDRYEDEKYFSLSPKIELGGYFAPLTEYELHWEDENWQEGCPYAWKEISQ